jgi:hypothetical protein
MAAIRTLSLKTSHRLDAGRGARRCIILGNGAPRCSVEQAPVIDPALNRAWHASC